MIYKEILQKNCYAKHTTTTKQKKKQQQYKIESQFHAHVTNIGNAFGAVHYAIAQIDFWSKIWYINHFVVDNDSTHKIVLTND